MLHVVVDHQNAEQFSPTQKPRVKLFEEQTEQQRKLNFKESSSHILHVEIVFYVTRNATGILICTRLPIPEKTAVLV